VGGGETITASFTVTNTGQRECADVPQLYLTDAPREAPAAPLVRASRTVSGESREVTLAAAPRPLARFDGTETNGASAKAPTKSRSAILQRARADPRRVISSSTH
jgi:hypothetical protein